MSNVNIVSASSFSLSKKLDLNSDDSILLPKRVGNGYLMAIADGVGKYVGAKIASSAAIDILDKIERTEELQDFNQLFGKIHKRLSTLAQNNVELGKMATTLTVCFIDEQYIRIGHTGDSRAYLYKENKLLKLTSDQTEHQMLISEGIFTEKQLKNHPRKNVLVSALSPRMELSIQEVILPFSPTLIYLMSDGAYAFWEENPKFSEATMENTNAFCASLEKRIKRKSPIDDFSVIGAHFESSVGCG